MIEGVKDAVLVHLGAIKDGIVNNMEQGGRNASGRSVASLNVVATDSGGYLEGLPSFMVMERGRAAGKVPMRFTDIIRDWILAKGISYSDLIPKNGNRETGLRRLSGAIAYSIMKKGSRLHRDRGYNDIFSTLIDEELSKIERETAALFEIEVDRIHQTEEDYLIGG